MRSKADETLVIVKTLICPLQISHYLHFYTFRENQVLVFRFFLRMFLIVDFFNFLFDKSA